MAQKWNSSANDPFAQSGPTWQSGQPGVDSTKQPGGIAKQAPPKESAGRSAAMTRLAASLSRISSSSRGANSRDLFLP